jgi:hypothetical protein
VYYGFVIPKNNSVKKKAIELDALSSRMLFPVIFVHFPLASCVIHVPRPIGLATYRVKCEACSERVTTELEYTRPNFYITYNH